MKIDACMDDGTHASYYAEIPCKSLEEAAEYIMSQKWIWAENGGTDYIVFTNHILRIQQR